MHVKCPITSCLWRIIHAVENPRNDSTVLGTERRKAPEWKTRSSPRTAVFLIWDVFFNRNIAKQNTWRHGNIKTCFKKVNTWSLSKSTPKDFHVLGLRDNCNTFGARKGILPIESSLARGKARRQSYDTTKTRNWNVGILRICNIHVCTSFSHVMGWSLALGWTMISPWAKNTNLPVQMHLSRSRSCASLSWSAPN